MIEETLSGLIVALLVSKLSQQQMVVTPLVLFTEMSNYTLHKVLYLLFLFSGFCGLQDIWNCCVHSSLCELSRSARQQNQFSPNIATAML